MKLLKRAASLVLAAIITAAASISTFAAEALTTAENSREYGSEIKYVSEPKANHDSGWYDENLYIKLTCSTSGARIFYTTDGSDPTVFSEEYKSTIRLKGEKGESTEFAIRAIAVKTGYETSDIANFYYTIELPADPEIEYMEIKRNPTKTNYRKGDPLTLTGGTIIVSYDDGTYQTLDMTPDMISGFNTNTIGRKTVYVSYKEFTDSYEINVTARNSTTDDETSEDFIDYPTEDLRARIEGTSICGWEAISEAFSECGYGDSVTILLNDSSYIDKEILKIAASRMLELTFVADTGIEWKLDTASLLGKTITHMGLGVRTTAISIPQTTIDAIGGTEAAKFHINGANSMGAILALDLSGTNYNKFASLFRYDTESGKLVLVDTTLSDYSSYAEFDPVVGGDYVVITDNETKIRGDVNNDTRIDSTDASMLLRLIVLNKTDNSKYDFDRNGKVNTRDVSAILRFVNSQK